MLSLLAAYIPEVPTDILTSISGNQMKVQWTLPSDNGSPITAYRVFIQEINSGTFTEETVDCVGTDSIVIANAFCYVTVSTLLASPYNVDGGDYIWAKVMAANVYGETAISTEGNGAYYTRVPDIPINLAEDT